jgi:hypothetical protein
MFARIERLSQVPRVASTSRGRLSRWAASMAEMRTHPFGPNYLDLGVDLESPKVCILAQLWGDPEGSFHLSKECPSRSITVRRLAT